MASESKPLARATARRTDRSATEIANGGYASRTPLETMRALWQLITNTRALHFREQESLQRIHTLQQANLSLAEKVEQLTHREARARYLANHDGLTGLCNRSLLMDRFVQAAAHADRYGHTMALLLFDLDGFKAVNDRFGHMAGDRLLQRIAEQLNKIARTGDTVCRYGGDEFVMLLPGIDSAANARLVAGRAGKCIADCLRMDNIQVTVGASCGIALYPDEGNNWHSLMEAADIAMYLLLRLPTIGYEPQPANRRAIPNPPQH